MPFGTGDCTGASAEAAVGACTGTEVEDIVTGSEVLFRGGSESTDDDSKSSTGVA